MSGRWWFFAVVVVAGGGCGLGDAVIGYGDEPMHALESKLASQLGDNCASGAAPITLAPIAVADRHSRIPPENPASNFTWDGTERLRVGVASGSTAGMGNDVRSEMCHLSGNAPDAVHAFTLEAAALVTIGIKAPANPLFSLHGPSPTCTSGRELLCRPGAQWWGPHGPTSDDRGQRVLPPGTYWLWVESAAGPYTVSVVALEVSAVPDRCLAPVPLTFDSSGMATAARAGPQRADSEMSLEETFDWDYTGQAHTPILTDNAYSRCGAGRWQTVYAFTQPVTGRFSAKAVGSGGNKPSLYLRKVCFPGQVVSDDAELACGNALTQGGTTAAIDVPSLPAGDYFLVANTDYQGGTGEYVLTATRPAVRAATNETCATARTILTGGATTARFEVDLADARADHVGTCVNRSYVASLVAGGKDLVYRFTLAQPRRVVVTSTGAAPTDSVLYLRRGGCQPTADVPRACADRAFGGTERLDLDLAVGDYHLFVDGFSAQSSGRQTVTVDTFEPTVELGSVDWTVTGDGPELTGRRLSATCSKKPTRDWGPAWGTEVFTDDSSICSAAAREGVIDSEGGPVTIEISGGEPSYTGSTGNGMTTLSYSAWHRSFVVVR